MQRVSSPRSRRDRSDGPAQRHRQSPVAVAYGTVAAAGLTTLAPAFVQALPSLDTVPTAYTHEFHAELLYDLCAALLREGLGMPETWRTCGESSVVFAQHSIMSAIGKDRWNLLKRNVEYHLNISDVADRGGCDTPLEDGKLMVTIECGGAGYVRIGAAIEALEQEAEDLGAAFYWTFTHALYRVMRLYNHDDAMEYEERMREYAQDDDSGSGEQYEFPEVEKALPECIRKSLEKDDHQRTLDMRQLLRRHRCGRYGSWLDRLRTIERLARAPFPQPVDLLNSGNYDSAPLPSLVVVFKENDAIAACFDEEGQYMLEGSSEPAIAVAFSPREPSEVREAIRVVSRFIRINAELFQLVEELQE
jgi:hypothetical protein